MSPSLAPLFTSRSKTPYEVSTCRKLVLISPKQKNYHGKRMNSPCSPYIKVISRKFVLHSGHGTSSSDDVIRVWFVCVSLKNLQRFGGASLIFKYHQGSKGAFVPAIFQCIWKLKYAFNPAADVPWRNNKNWIYGIEMSSQTSEKKTNTGTQKCNRTSRRCKVQTEVLATKTAMPRTLIYLT